jgi:hypothetical protein
MNKAKSDWIVINGERRCVYGKHALQGKTKMIHPHRGRTAIIFNGTCCDGDGGSLGLVYGEREVCP